MSNINELLERVPFTDEAIVKIAESIQNYQRFAKVFIEIWPDLQINEKIVTIRVTQKELVNDKVLTKEELNQRVDEVFNGLLPDGFIIDYVPVTYLEWKQK